MSVPLWEQLAENGAEITSAFNGRAIRVDNLALETALKIGVALTLSLDTLSSTPSYNKDDLISEANDALSQSDYQIFGEKRPAHAKCGVRIIRSVTSNGFMVYSDLRNQFVDNPYLNGKSKLQQKFAEAIESLDI